jgi:hypothetical protein
MVADVPELNIGVTVTITADPPTNDIRGLTVVVDIDTPADFHAGAVSGMYGLLSREHEATAGIGGFGDAETTGPQEYTFTIRDDVLSWRQAKTHFSRRWLSFVFNFDNAQSAELLLEAGDEARVVINAAYAAWEAEAAPAPAP